MAESEKISDLNEALKPFFQRATEAEERLSGLEIALASKKDAGNEDHLKIISDYEAKLEVAHAELISEHQNAQKLATENAKLRYRIHHLVRALKEADQKLEQVMMHK